MFQSCHEAIIKFEVIEVIDFISIALNLIIVS